MRSDSYGWIWNGFGSWNWNWNWTLTLTGTEPWQELEWWVGSMGSDSSWIRELELMFLSRIDGIGLVVDPGTWQELDPWLELDRWAGSMGSDSSWIRELELMFLSRIDGIGLVWIRELDRNLILDWNWTGTWPLTGTGLELDPWLELDWNLTLDWNWTGESDRWDRTRRGSGNWNLCFWVGSMGSDSSWIRELDRNLTLDWNWTGTWPLTGTGTLTAWLEPGPWLLGWNRDLLWIFTGSSLEPDLLCLAGTGTVKVEWESSWKPVESGFQI